MNCQGLTNKFDIFRILIDYYNNHLLNNKIDILLVIDVILLQETWLNNGSDFSLSELFEYNEEEK